MKFIITLILGFCFGSILIYSQAYSWYRIQEMFHFESFHMFGLLFSAIGTSVLALFILKKFGIKSASGNHIEVKPKPAQLKANIAGGLIFGIGWSISGACSAPVYVLVGMHWQIGLFLLAGALLGTIVYGVVESKIPH